VNDNATPEEAVWKALLELEPKLAQMEEPDVPRLAAKFLDELRLSGFVLVPLTELEQLQTAADALVKRRF
jgi:hypothetical protein